MRTLWFISQICMLLSESRHLRDLDLARAEVRQLDRRGWLPWCDHGYQVSLMYIATGDIITMPVAHCLGALCPMPAWVWRDVRSFYLFFNLGGLFGVFFVYDLHTKAHRSRQLGQSRKLGQLGQAPSGVPPGPAAHACHTHHPVET